MEKKLFRVLNTIDEYTFYAPDIIYAAMAVQLMNEQLGVQDVETDERTPPTGIPFLWDAWAHNKGVSEEFARKNLDDIFIEMYESFLIGSSEERPMLEKQAEDFKTKEEKEDFYHSVFKEKGTAKHDLRYLGMKMAESVRG